MGTDSLTTTLAAPRPPLEDPVTWGARPYGERLRSMGATWATQGFGAPPLAYLFYVVKIVFFVGGFVAVATLTPGLGPLGSVGAWWATPLAFGKAVLWTLLWEALGLGCGSGPLTGRYLPPVTAAAHWLRPRTVRLPPWPALPLTRGDRRTPVDVALFAAFVILVMRGLASSQLGPSEIVPIVVVFALAGLRDKAVFLSGRSEHYLLAALIIALVGEPLTAAPAPSGFWAAEKLVMVGLWFGAASSKLNRHFPAVIAVMLSNNPLVGRRFRHRLYRSYPDDLRPSHLAAGIAHTATVVEYSFPLVLLLASPGWLLTGALVVMVTFHVLILTSFPLGVPLEWNVFFIYSGLVLFGVHAEVRPWEVGSAVLWVLLGICLVVLPVVGNLRPDKVSFLPSMRYYAGNWACSQWLLGPGALERIDDALPTAARSPRRQITRLYGTGVYEVVLGRTQAFRSMHLHGRVLNSVLPLAVADLGGTTALDSFEIVDGELVAGLVVGWNFGDGHLHHEQLLAAVQRACNFAPGEVRAVLVESQPAASGFMAWRVVDAASGVVARGRVRVADLTEAQPWDLDASKLEVETPEATP